MSRERFIYPEIWKSQTFVSLDESDPKLLWIGLITLADDEGRGHACPIVLKAIVFPTLSLNLDQLWDMLLDLENKGFIRLYQVGGSTFYDIPNWKKYQRLKYIKESKIPSYDSSSPQKGDNLSRNWKTRYVGLRRDGLRRDVLEPPTPLEGGEGISEKEEPPPEDDDAKALVANVAFWNEHVAPVLKAPTVRELTDKRSRGLKRRLKDHPDMWNEILVEAKYLKRELRDGASWITFDFFLSENNLAKWLDGNYSQKSEQRRRDDGSKDSDTPF